MVRSRFAVRLLTLFACVLLVGATFTEAQSRKPSKPRPASSAAAQKRTAPTPDGIATSPDFTLQVALDRAGFSPGQIDGKGGALTKRALATFQRERGLQPSGEIDEQSWTALGVRPGQPDAVVTKYTITADDVKGPFTESIPEDMVEKSKLSALGYTSAHEALAERFHIAPELLQALNPGAAYKEGEAIVVPSVAPPPAPSAAASSGREGARGRSARGNQQGRGAVGTGGTASGVTVSVSKAAEALTVRDGSGKILMFAPVTVGSEHDPLPIGQWKVTGVQRNPAFNYNPDLFWDADPSHTKAKIPPGPNNPVGVVWVDLDRPHYGIHGTPEPGKVGYRQSHGCVRLTNWDALKLASLVGPGTPVIFEP